jgi:cytochrome c oxidase cbb3-type subunit 3
MSDRARRVVGVITRILAGIYLLGAVHVWAADAPASDAPRPPGDPAEIARGKQVFSVNCGFCHGSDGRGGEGGPNLLRSPLVLADQKGEVIYAVTLVGRPDKGMPKFDLSLDTIADVAAYLHSIPTGPAEKIAFDPSSIVVGNAAAGKAFFNGKGHCSQCHSLKGDFARIGARLDPKTLQDNIISAGAATKLGAPLPNAPPRTVTVTLASGEVIKGTLVSVDDFDVTLTDASGQRRTLSRHGAQPHVDIKNPLQAHLDLAREWDDRDIHNLTAFLVTQK